MPEYDFDVIADLKALKTTYNGQVIRDFDLSVDFMNNTLKIQNLSATMPGEASAKISGEVFGVEKKMTYNFNLTSSMSDFGKFAKWLKLGWSRLPRARIRRQACRRPWKAPPR